MFSKIMQHSGALMMWVACPLVINIDGHTDKVKHAVCA